MRKRDEKARARRLSEYVDGLIVHLRAEQSAKAGNNDSLDDLETLASDLTGVRLVTPASAREDVKRRLVQRLSNPEPLHWSWRSAFLNYFKRRHGTIYASATGLACTFGLLAAFYFLQPPQLLVATILARSDAALKELAGPGEVLHREWKITIKHETAKGETRITEHRRVEEWLREDGESSSAKRMIGADGTVLMSFSARPEAGHLLQEAYFPPNPEEPYGLLSIEPGRDELRLAIPGFPPSKQGVLLAWLDRAYTDPVKGEQRFNRTALFGRTDVPLLPRAVVHLSTGRHASGEEYYRIHLDEPRRVGFRWTVEGPPCSWIEHKETVTYISAASYLSWRTEETHMESNGDRLTVTRDLVKNEVLPKQSLGTNVFALSVDAGTPVRSQSANELLHAVLSAIENGAAERNLRPARASCASDRRFLW